MTVNGPLTVSAAFTLNTYAISGSVMTSGGASVAGATMTLGGAKSAVATTDVNGFYNFSGLVNGVYSHHSRQDELHLQPCFLEHEYQWCQQNRAEFRGGSPGPNWRLSRCDHSSLGCSCRRCPVAGGFGQLAEQRRHRFRARCRKPFHKLQGYFRLDHTDSPDRRGQQWSNDQYERHLCKTDGFTDGDDLPNDSGDAGAKWRVAGGIWRSSGERVDALAVGDHVVDYLTITGWDAPAAQTVTLTSGIVSSATGVCTQQSLDPTGTSLSVTPNIAARGSKVTVAFNNITNRIAWNWVGLFAEGKANTAYTTYFFAGSCTKSPGAAVASGSVSLPFPPVSRRGITNSAF